MQLVTLSLEQMLLVAAGLLLLGVLASKMSSKLGIPALVLFLGIGVAAGSEGVGGIPFEDYDTARIVGTIALAFILFAGGLETPWRRIRTVLWRGVSLATCGVIVTTVVFGLFVRWLLALSWVESMLLGAIVASTDAAAVFGVLRARRLRLRHDLTAALEFESGSNDPTAIFLTTMLTSVALTGSNSITTLDVIAFFVEMFLGGLIGLMLGYVWVRGINRARLEYDGLYPVLTIALVLLSFALSALVGGNGFLCVYVAGVTLGSHNFVHRLALIQFHDGLAWLMQITLFLVLGLLVFPSQLLPVAGIGLLLAVVLVIVARPVAVFSSLILASLTVREKLFISWVGLRGAVPIVLATIPISSGVPGSEVFFNVVFFVVVVSVILQGSFIPLVARLLRVGPGHTERKLGEVPVPQATIEVVVRPSSAAAGRQVVDLNLPPSALILLLHRGTETYLPRGSTVLAPGDRLTIATRKGDTEELKRLIEG
ncbi:MAG: potassium/proton antiporter [Armatimonadota bacterium]